MTTRMARDRQYELVPPIPPEFFPRPRWTDFKPNPEKIDDWDKEDVIFRVSLPYSDLQWWDQSQLRDVRLMMLRHPEFPPEAIIPPSKTLDRKGKLLPGNITDKLYWEIHHNLPLWRLAEIRQLSFLADAPAEEQEQSYGKGPDYRHTRLEHSFLTGRLAESIARNNQRSEIEVDFMITAGTIHDIAIPAKGDATLELDVKALAEEIAIERILGKYDLSFLRPYKVDGQTVIEIVRGVGTQGRLLDIVDKLAYTATDI